MNKTSSHLRRVIILAAVFAAASGGVLNGSNITPLPGQDVPEVVQVQAVSRAPTAEESFQMREMQTRLVQHNLR